MRLRGVPGGLQKPMRRSLEVPAGLVEGRKVPRDSGGVVRVELCKAFRGPQAHLDPLGWRQSGAEGLLIEHVNEFVFLARRVASWLFTDSMNERVNGFERPQPRF